MASTLEGLRRKYESDREHDWMRWLTINAEVDEKYGNRSYLFASYQKLIYNLEYPTDEDLKVFQAAEYNTNGYTPILLRGVVIDNTLDEDGGCRLQLVSINEEPKYDAETLLHLRDCASVFYTILANDLYSDRTEYTIGDIQKIRPGEKVIIAATNIAVSPRNKQWIHVQFTDIARDLNKTDYTFLDKHYRIHQSEAEYLALYDYLARGQKTDKHVPKNVTADVPKRYENPEGVDEAPRQKGCFWTIIKWLFLLSLISVLLQKCNFVAPESADIESGVQNSNAVLNSETHTSGSLEQSTTVSTSSNEVEEVKYRPPKFSKPKILEDYCIQKVSVIKNDLAVILVRNEEDNDMKILNLKTGEELLDTSLLRASGNAGRVENMLETLGTRSADSVIKVSLLEGAFMAENELQIVTIMGDRQAYIGRRSVNTFEYSGYEYAIINFDGTIIRGWIRDDKYGEISEYLGDGVFYWGNGEMIDVFSGTVFQWPTIREVGYSSITFDNYANDSITSQGYIDGECLVSRSEADDYGNPVAHEFYSIGKAGECNKISRRSPVNFVEYVDALNSYLCVSCDNYTSNTAEDSTPHTNYSISDMYGNVILNMGDARVVYHHFGKSYITIGQLSEQGSGNTVYYSFYDYQGKELHAPFATMNLSLPKLGIYESDVPQDLGVLGCYGIIENDALEIYDMDDRLVHKFEPIVEKEKILWKTIENTYYPLSVDIYEQYYVVTYDNEHSYIGKVDYVPQKPNFQAVNANQSDGFPGSNLQDEHATVPQETHEPIYTASPETTPAPTAWEEKGWSYSFVGEVVNVTDYLNVREHPSTSSERVGILRLGDIVTIHETKFDGWMQWGRCDQGWVSLNYINEIIDSDSISESPHSQPDTSTNESPYLYLGQVINITDYLNVREYPSTGATRVGILHLGDTVKIYETQYSGSIWWGRCDQGWVSLEYVEELM